MKPTRLNDEICDRFVLIPSAAGISKTEFAKRVGLTPQQVSNIAAHRNPPDHEALAAAIREFGVTADWFYSGVMFGIRDPKLARHLRSEWIAAA